MPASLDRLPLELLQIILNGVEDKRDQLSLANCCSRVRQRALLYCYTSLVLKLPCHSRLGSLLKLIYNDPQVGHSVQELQLEGWSTSQDPRDPLRQTPSLVEEEITSTSAPLDEALEYLGYSWEDAKLLKEFAAKGTADIYVVLLLLNLPNIRKLCLRFPRGSPFANQLFGTLSKIEKSFQSRLPFTKLTQVLVSPYDFSMGLPRNSSWKSFTLSDLQQISAFTIPQLYDYYHRRALEPLYSTIFWPVTSPITHIELACTEKFSQPEMLEIIKGTADPGNRSRNRCLARWLLPFSRVPEHVKSTLQVLRLGYEYKYDFNEGLKHQTVDSWADFPALVDIHLSVYNLIYFRRDPPTHLSTVLPSCLESLSIGDCPRTRLPRVLSEVKDLTLNARTKFPHLSRIVIEGYWFMPSETFPASLTPFNNVAKFLPSLRDLNASGVSVILKTHPSLYVSVQQVEFVDGEMREERLESSPIRKFLEGYWPFCHRP